MLLQVVVRVAGRRCVVVVVVEVEWLQRGVRLEVWVGLVGVGEVCLGRYWAMRRRGNITASNSSNNKTNNILLLLQ